MNVLLDTNVLIAAFISHGTCAELLEYCSICHDLPTSEFILSEFQRTLSNSFAFSTKQVNDAQRLLRDRMIIVIPADVPNNACRDTQDLPVLGTAVSGQCHCIVTGDKDLLSLVRYEEIDIISPADFWEYESHF